MARTTEPIPVSAHAPTMRGVAVVCLLALALHGLWPLLPMPSSWQATAEAAAGTPLERLATASGCGALPLPAGHTPHQPRRRTSDHPLTCSLCAYLHAVGGLPALPAPLLRPPTAVSATKPQALRHLAPPDRPRGVVRSRAPPAFPIA